MESDDGSETEILAQALPVSKLPEKYDPRFAPTTGEEYLSRVRDEASKNKIVVAKIDTKKFEKNRTAQFYQSVNTEKFYYLSNNSCRRTSRKRKDQNLKLKENGSWKNAQNLVN